MDERKYTKDELLLVAGFRVASKDRRDTMLDLARTALAAAAARQVPSDKRKHLHLVDSVE